MELFFKHAALETCCCFNIYTINKSLNAAGSDPDHLA